MKNTDTIPRVPELLWPTLQATRSLGGKGSIEEIDEQVARIERFTDAQLSEVHNNGPRTRLQYRGAWARSNLKVMGLLDNPDRGIWQLTDRSADIRQDQIQELYKNAVRAQRKKKRDKPASVIEDDVTEMTDENWVEHLLRELGAMAPDAFERLSERLLRRAGFVNTAVTGRTGDGGIDGQGVYRVSLVSFPVFFQCKRHRGSVGPSVIRDFRGAMAGRGDKGLLITTGSFSTNAVAEATRDGAPPVDLIDGERLCELLKQYDLGVTTTVRQVEDVTVDTHFFRHM